MGEGLVNVHAIAQQFEWALENIVPPLGLWHGYKCEEFGYDEDIRQKTRDVFLSTDFFILTLGLSEIWYDEQTGGIFWRAVPKEHYDESRHKFRVCSFAETTERLERIYALIRKHVPDAKVLFTLSPVPLAATFRPVSCLTANSTSKAILRAALDEFYRNHLDVLNQSLFYFPSFEIVSELFFVRYEEDGRHPLPLIIDVIMHLFEAVYCYGSITIEHVEAMYQEMRDLNAKLPRTASITAETSTGL
jgi:GSCFA family